jgi:hypothetical protein
MGFRDFFKSFKTGVVVGMAGQTPQQAVRTPAPARRLDLGREDIEATGESYFQSGIAQVFIAAGRPLGGGIMRTAVLVADPGNPYDHFAVKVYVDGQQVAWIPAELAPDVQPVVNAVNASGRQLTVPARVWGCCEEGEWSGRVTLSLSGATEPEWSYVDVGSWPGNRSPDGTQRLTQTGLFRRIRDAEAAGIIRGRDFESLRPEIAQAKASGDVAGALSLLTECIEAAERRARTAWVSPAVWPTEQAAILLRKQKDYRGEIAVLERFLAADPSHEGTKGLRERLAKVRALVGDSTPVPEPQSVGDPRLSAPARFDVSPADLVSVMLPAAVELSFEHKYRDAITAVYVGAGAPMGTALETSAMLHEFRPPGKRYSLVAVYVGGRLIGYVSSGLYLDPVLAVLHSPAVANKTAVVRCRIYAQDTPKWSARATLGPYESVVESLEDTQSAAEGRAAQAVMAELRLQRLAAGGQEAFAQSQRLVQGMDFVEWVEPIKQMRRDGDDDSALQVLMECIEAAERDALAHGWQPPTWYTQQAGIILRKQGDHAGEVALLERYLAACPDGTPQPDIAERLIKARAKAEKNER